MNHLGKAIMMMLSDEQTDKSVQTLTADLNLACSREFKKSALYNAHRTKVLEAKFNALVKKVGRPFTLII